MTRNTAITRNAHITAVTIASRMKYSVFSDMFSHSQLPSPSFDGRKKTITMKRKQTISNHTPARRSLSLASSRALAVASAMMRMGM